MIRVGLRLPGPFHISGGPIIALFVMLTYVGMIMLWIAIAAAVYIGLGLGLAYAVTSGHTAWRKRHPRSQVRP
ncbi:hypothetical protein R6V09_21815 [Streptomyces sp. W16]|uniref:hypothetical protein n=1 Tax=Streptomyces sp. W16 TaxID=3076631 RepID=UPI00295B9E1B|nr:hypothetical protein [Streptomyces sp. W16]MDV9172736.1 hypothetical protein [Streptomyces sp. W16]